ncbi:MAG: YihY/virulence factor BrkB family protein, partial [Oscillospiraceae bacterium]|nr:YihY/virulence factor BrkB family protein [Oscillospiraceae bacterium]
MTKKFIESKVRAVFAFVKARKLYAVAESFIAVYAENDGDAAAAHLAYNLTLSLFPLLICLNALISLLNIHGRDVLEWLRGIVPETALRLFGEYTDYVAAEFSVPMLIGALVLILGAGAGAFRGVVEICRDVMRVEVKSGIRQYLSGFVFAIGFLVAVYVAV